MPAMVKTSMAQKMPARSAATVNRTVSPVSNLTKAVVRGGQMGQGSTVKTLAKGGNATAVKSAIKR